MPSINCYQYTKFAKFCSFKETWPRSRDVLPGWLKRWIGRCSPTWRASSLPLIKLLPRICSADREAWELRQLQPCKLDTTDDITFRCIRVIWLLVQQTTWSFQQLNTSNKQNFERRGKTVNNIVTVTTMQHPVDWQNGVNQYMCNIYHIDNMKTLSSSILIDLIWVISLAVGLLYIVGFVFLFLVFSAFKNFPRIHHFIKFMMPVKPELQNLTHLFYSSPSWTIFLMVTFVTKGSRQKENCFFIQPRRSLIDEKW